MAYAQSYGMGPNAQYNYEPMFRRGGYGAGSGPSNENYNMGVQSPYSPPNNGGPGNPGTANNMPRPTLPRFQQFQNNKGPAPLTPQDRAMQQMSGQISGMQLPQDFNPWSGGFGQGGSNQGASDARQGMQNQNNKGPAPLQGYNPNSPAQLDQRAIAADPQGFAQWQREAAAAGYNYGNSGQQGQQGVQSGPPASLLQSFNSLMGGGQQGGYNGSGINPPIPREDNYYRRPNTGGDPFNQYGYAGQSQQLGRYVPPMMGNVNDMNSWQGGGGYAYNIPNSYGSGQWNQFNSRDVAFPQFGQSQNVPTPRLNPGTPPPSYQSPFGRPDPMRQQNYLAYMMNLGQGGQAQSNSTQPGAPDQPPPVV